MQTKSTYSQLYKFKVLKKMEQIFQKRLEIRQSFLVFDLVNIFQSSFSQKCIIFRSMRLVYISI